MKYVALHISFFGHLSLFLAFCVILLLQYLLL